MKKSIFVLAVMAFFVMSGSCDPSLTEREVPMTSLGNPAEGDLAVFKGDPFLEKQVVFTSDNGNVREPYLTVAVDGTILALRNRAPQSSDAYGHLRRSEDGGETWGDIIEVPFGFRDTSFVPDENSGDIVVVRIWDDVDKLWRSRDHGKTWSEERITLKSNEVMKWIEQAELKERVSWQERGSEGYGTSGRYTMHGNASESGITLRHGENKGRLIVTATFRPHAPEHPSDRKPADYIYSTAIYSDDGGATWQVSGLFPEGTTEEAALEELHDGTIYYNSRSGSGFYDKALERELRPEEILRREAWSYDGGNTWEDLRVSPVLPDGGGVHRGYGNKGGLARLPVDGRDILIYSNTDTAGGDRVKMTVWASFDGGDTWPVKRLLDPGPSAYSCLNAGRPGTPSEGIIYLLYEGGPEGAYSAMQVASFNLSWILEDGEMTGDGKVPEWVQ